MPSQGLILSELPTEGNFREIRENEFTLASQLAWKIEYWLDDPSKSLYNFEIYSIVEGKLFILHYRALPMNVPTTIPLANNMIGSFQFLNWVETWYLFSNLFMQLVIRTEFALRR